MEVNEVENELKHWGILGMKWGVRRYQNPDGSLTPEGRERYSQILNKSIKSENTKYKIAVKAIKVMNSKLPEINAQFTDGYSKEYGDAISKAWKEIYGDFLKKEYGEIADLLYDDAEEWLNQFTYYTIYDDLNHSDFLQHWGILGMKWGIRNYQNPDGSLTPEGRIRYGVGPARSTGALLKGINDAGSLSDEELRKMSKRYRAQAEYLQNMNEFLKQERYMKQQVTPERKPKGPSAIGTFAKRVFGEPFQNFLAQNVKFGLGAAGYEILKSEHPNIAAQYFNSVTGLDMHYKTKEQQEKEEMQKKYDLLKLQNAQLEYMNNLDKRNDSKSERERKERNDEINLERNKLEVEKLRKTVNNMDNNDSRYTRNKDAKLEADYITNLNKITKNMRPIYNKMYDEDANQFVYSYFAELAEDPIYKDLNFNTNVPVELKNATDKWGFTYKELLDMYGLK